jgi:hypothetical protein
MLWPKLAIYSLPHSVRTDRGWRTRRATMLGAQGQEFWINSRGSLRPGSPSESHLLPIFAVGVRSVTPPSPIDHFSVLAQATQADRQSF